MTFDSFNPATGDRVWSGQTATRDDVKAAVARARAALAAWSMTSIDERKALLVAYAEVCKRNSGDLAAAIRDEAGKVQSDAEQEAAAVVGKVAATISAFDQRRSETTFDMSGVTARTSYRPIGVLAVLGPFNFPCHLPNGHIVPALLAGNTVVFKPSELTPFCGELLAIMFEQAGFPEGVVNLVQGGREVGEALADADIDGLLFTGGANAGLALHKKFADRPDKMLALELGGNNPLVVHEVADLDKAVALVTQSAYVSAGQRCTCARRLIVTDAVPPAFLEKLQAATRELKVGLPTDTPCPFLGPVITAQAATRVLDAQCELLARGATALVESKRWWTGGTGRTHSDAGDPCPTPTRPGHGFPTADGVQPVPPRDSAFVTPGLIDVTTIERRDEEIFGPLLQVIRVPDLDAAIEESNATRFGLAAGILTDDRAAYETFARRVKAGIINWNRPLPGASGQLPFGGVGLSGNFRPSGSFAVDYTTYAVASLESDHL